MAVPPPTTPESTGPLGQASASLRTFMQTESAGAGLLFIAGTIALILANSPWSGAWASIWDTRMAVTIGSIGIDLDLGHWVNDGLMAVFFFVIGLEVRKELSVGELTDRRRIAVPLIAGLAGVVVPTLIYLAFNPSGEAARAWGIVVGTDTAFLLGALALVGPTVSTQLRIFLLTLTVIDDIIAVSIIGIVYSDRIDTVPLVVAGLGLVGIALLARLHVSSYAPYFILAVLVWASTLESGMHASIAGMLSGLLIPARHPDRRAIEATASRFQAFRQSPGPHLGRSAVRSVRRAVSVNERLQTMLHGWTSFAIVPIFALANTGIDLRDGALGDALGSRLTWGIVAGLVLGKLIGIGVGALASNRAGLSGLPRGVGRSHVLGGAALSGIGFTVSLLIVGLAFDDRQLHTRATVGVLLAALIAIAVAWVIFAIGRRVFGAGDAALPMVLSEPVDPERDHILGPPDAPFTLVEYLDFECPFCARSTDLDLLLRAHFGDRLRYVIRHLPLEIHPNAYDAALALEAAAEQGKWPEMFARMFEHQDRLESDDLVEHAAAIGLDVGRFLDDLGDDDHERRIREDIASADESGARGTPTFFIDGQRHIGQHDAATLIAAIEASRADRLRDALAGDDD